MILKVEIPDSLLARYLGVSRQCLLKHKKNRGVDKWLTRGLHGIGWKLLEISELDPLGVDKGLTEGLHLEEKKSEIKEKEEFPLKENNIINNIIKETPPKPKPKPLRVDDLSQYDWVDDRIREQFQRWIEYKRQIRDSYKTEQGMKIKHNQLLKWCGGDAEIAKMIVDHSIGNEYQGLFPPKPQDIERSRSSIGVVLHNGTNRENKQDDNEW